MIVKEFIELANNKYLVKDSNGLIVDKKEKLKMEKEELILEDVKSNDCQKNTTRKIKKINKKIKEEDNGTNSIEETIPIKE